MALGTRVTWPPAGLPLRPHWPLHTSPPPSRPRPCAPPLPGSACTCTPSSSTGLPPAAAGSSPECWSPEDDNSHLPSEGLLWDPCCSPQSPRPPQALQGMEAKTPQLAGARGGDPGAPDPGRQSRVTSLCPVCPEGALCGSGPLPAPVPRLPWPLQPQPRTRAAPLPELPSCWELTSGGHPARPALGSQPQSSGAAGGGESRRRAPPICRQLRLAARTQQTEIPPFLAAKQLDGA